MAPIQPIRVVFGSERCASSPRLTLAGYDLIWQAQCCHLEFVQFEILINELGATLCFCRCCSRRRRRCHASRPPLPPFSGQFVFYSPFLYPSSSQSSSKGDCRGLRSLWGEIVVSHHSRWYQWLWVTQLEGPCVFCTCVCVSGWLLEEKLWLLLADADGVRVSGLALVPDLCTVALRSADTFFPSCLHTNCQHKTTTILILHPTARKGIVGIFEEFPCILSTKQPIGLTNNH